MTSGAFAAALEPVPRQDFVGSTADKLRVFVRHCLALDSSSHVGKGLAEVAAIRTGSPQRRHRSIQTLKVEAKLGSVHGPEYRHCGRTA